VSMTAKPTGKQKDKEQTISREDITRAIGLLSPLAGYSVVSIGGVDFVRSVPRELDTDQSALLVIAATTGGRLTETNLRQSLGWNDVRARRALEDSVMREGLGWVDDQGPQRAVWLIAAVEFEGQGLSGEL
jgi:ESCRT-II complex subunit VPS22